MKLNVRICNLPDNEFVSKCNYVMLSFRILSKIIQSVFGMSDAPGRILSHFYLEWIQLLGATINRFVWSGMYSKIQEGRYLITIKYSRQRDDNLVFALSRFHVSILDTSIFCLKFSKGFGKEL